MQHILIIAAIPLGSANGAIDNLVEADFSESDITLIAENDTVARRIIDDNGPLKGEKVSTLFAALTWLRLAQAAQIAASVKDDIALIAVSVDASSVASAKELLKTAGATLMGQA